MARKKEVENKYYGRPEKDFTLTEIEILTKIGEDKIARQFYDTLWQEFSYAYQMILYEYALQRQYNPDMPPEQQIRNIYSNEHRLSDYKLPLEFAVIVRQIAMELSNLPKAKWFSVADVSNKEAQAKSLVFQKTYDWVFQQCDGEWEQFKTLLSKAIYGTAVEWVYHDYQTYPDKEAVGFKDGQVVYKDIKRVISQTKFKNLDVRHFLVDRNATDINSAEHATVLINMGWQSFQKAFGNTEIYDISNVKPCSIQEVYVSLGESRKNTPFIGVQLAYWYSVPDNCHMLMANGKRINKKDWAIPVPSVNGKPWIPVAVFYQSKADNEFYGISQCAIIKPFREVKNKLRNCFFDISKKMAFNTLVIDPMSDFDESSYVFGQPFVRAVPDEVKPIQTSANLQPVIELDKQTDQDVITFTGINILNTAGGIASESATKTAVRQESQVQLVELGLKMNGFHGFSRRAVLLKQLIKLHMGSAKVKKIAEGPDEAITIATPGTQLKRGLLNPKKVYEEKSNGIGRFNLKQNDLEGDFDFIMEGGTVSATKELVKARQMEGAAFLITIPSDSEQLPYDSKALAKWTVQWAELPPDIARTNGMNIEDKTPDEITGEMDLLDKPNNPQEYLNQLKNDQAAVQGGNPQAPTPEGGRPLMAGTPAAPIGTGTPTP